MPTDRTGRSPEVSGCCWWHELRVHYICVPTTKRCQQRSLSILEIIHIGVSTTLKEVSAPRSSSKKHGKHIRLLDKVQHAAIAFIVINAVLWRCSNGSHKHPDNVQVPSKCCSIERALATVVIFQNGLADSIIIFICIVQQEFGNLQRSQCGKDNTELSNRILNTLYREFSFYRRLLCLSGMLLLGLRYISLHMHTACDHPCKLLQAHAFYGAHAGSHTSYLPSAAMWIGVRPSAFS